MSLHRVNCGQWLPSSSDYRNHAAIRFNPAVERTQILFVHERHVYRERQQMSRGCTRQSCADAAKRTARRRVVCHKRDIGRAPRRISACGNQNLEWRESSQKTELNSPERLSAKQQRRFIPAHPARLAAGKQNRADVHPPISETSAVDRNLPSLKIKARKPPRPLRNCSAPGAIAR